MGNTEGYSLKNSKLIEGMGTARCAWYFLRSCCSTSAFCQCGNWNPDLMWEGAWSSWSTGLHKSSDEAEALCLLSSFTD